MHGERFLKVQAVVLKPGAGLQQQFGYAIGESELLRSIARKMLDETQLAAGTAENQQSLVHAAGTLGTGGDPRQLQGLLDARIRGDIQKDSVSQ